MESSSHPSFKNEGHDLEYFTARHFSLNWICRKLARSLQFSISHIDRESNAEANHLANSAARRKHLTGWNHSIHLST